MLAELMEAKHPAALQQAGKVREVVQAVMAQDKSFAPQVANPPEREFFIDNLLVRVHFSIVMIKWTGLAPWENPPYPFSLFNFRS